MKKRFKPIVLSLCLLSVLLSSIVGCNKQNNTEPPVATGGADSSTQEPVAPDDNPLDANGYLKDSLDPNLDFGDTEFRILGWNSGYDCDFFAEMDVGDTVVDSVYYRNDKVNERLGVKIMTTFINGDNSSQAAFVETAVNSISSGNEYDMIGCYSMCSGTLATRGMIQDLAVLPHLDLEKPWWSESLISLSRMNDKLYFVTGDAANSFLYNMYFLSLNTSMMNELSLNDPRNMVRDLTWTLDEMMKMTKDVYLNLDEDSLPTKGDRYGLVMYSNVHLDCFLAASGIRMAAENDDGIMELTKEFTGEKTETMIYNLNQWLHGADCYVKTDGYPAVKDGNALFSAIAGSTIKGLRDVSYTFCVLPYPMYTADQGRYYTNLGFAYTNFCIPVNVRSAAMSAAVLECMNSEAYRSSSPTLFETCFKSRYSKDPESDYEMYDLIKSSIYVDANRVFSSSFVWADSAVSLFRNALAGNKTTWVSDMEGKKGSINDILASISNSVG